MKIQDINKADYRKKLNQITVAFIIIFATLAIVFGAILIAIFAQPVAEGATASNFKYNLAGVIMALVTMAMLANSLKKHVFVQDIYYVWQLKQLHNRIYRKFKDIKQAFEQGNDQAKIVLAFYYKTLKQVYELDDNTLTIANVNAEITRLQQQFGEQGFEQLAAKFDKSMLKDNYKAR